MVTISLLIVGIVVTRQLVEQPQDIRRQAQTSSVELFSDPNFTNGVAVGYANTYPDTPSQNYDHNDQSCIQRWSQILPNYSQTKWMFTEISERFFFCDNQSNNPQVTANSISYISPNAGMKQFISHRNGHVQMIYDTTWEWRGGCNLCKSWPGVTPSTPTYGNPLSNWPHFLLSQFLSPSYVPSQYDIGQKAIQPSERISLSKYNQLLFSGSFKLNNTNKPDQVFNCPAGDWKPNSCQESICQQNCQDVPNHAIFYVAFVLWRNQWNNPMPANTPNVVYQLLPLVYTENGVVNIGGDKEYLMGDQFGDSTYFAKFGQASTSGVRKLTPGVWVDINIDVNQFSTDVLKFINPSLNPNDYFVAATLIGWEIWGGYQTDIEIRSLSLQGITEVIPTLKPTNTPTSIPTIKPTNTPTLKPTSTPIPTLKPTSTPIPTLKPTSTPIPTQTPTPISNSTSTPIPTLKPTNTPVPTIKSTPTSTSTKICTPCHNSSLKLKGDANCDGFIDVVDRSIWSAEFLTDGGNLTKKNYWLSDFNCDGYVNVTDRSIWSANFIF